MSRMILVAEGRYRRGALALTLILITVSYSRAATLRVALDGSGDYAEIQPAIDAAADGDEVLVTPGEYVIAAPITFRGKPITVKSEGGSEVTTIRMSETPTDPKRASVVIFEEGESQDSVLEGLQVTGGKGTSVDSWRRGGGVLMLNASTATIRNCFVTGNSSDIDGGGVYCENSSSPSLTNCIAWGNTPESVCGERSHCLTDQDPRFVRPGEWLDCGSPDDPLCIAYQWTETGAPTAWHRWVFDYHLQPGSPCIGAGSCAGAPPVDIDGTPRPQGPGCDIGAYEYPLDCNENGQADWTEIASDAAQDCDRNGVPDSCDIQSGAALDANSNGVPDGCEVRFFRGESTGDGKSDISDAISILGWLFLGGAAPGCASAANANGDGAIDLSDAVYLLAYLFLGGPALPAPHPECGLGTLEADEALGCESFESCR